MPGQVYRLSFNKPTPSAISSDPASLESLTNQAGALGRSLGRTLLLSASLRWSNQRFDAFTVELFPSQEAIHAFTDGLRELCWYNHYEGESYLGIPMDQTISDLTGSIQADPCASCIYRVYLSRPSPAGHALKPAEMGDLLERTRQASHASNAEMLLSAYTRWNNETWEYFGVERFPDISDVLRYSQYLSTAGWYQYTESQSFLGMPTGGLLSGRE